MTPVAAYAATSCTTGRDAFGFCDSASKTDNFKVKAPGKAYITVCKFQACNLSDDTGTCGGAATDPLLSGWTIDATGAKESSEITAGFGEATPFGCATFTVETFSGSSATVGLTEVLQSGWEQTAPDSNTPGSSQCTATGSIPSVTGVAGETCTVSPGDNIAAPNFGNVAIIQGVPLTLVKTANGGYNTTYKWQIDKSASPTTVYSAGGGTSGQVTYTVTVTHDNGTVSNVKVTGDITITNANRFAITVASVTDTLDNPASTTCSVSGLASDGSVSVPAGDGTTAGAGSVDLPYTCDLGSTVPIGQVDNTVVISWNAQQGILNGVPWQLKADSTTYTAQNISFTNGLIDGSVNVTDPLGGGTLGTVSSTDPSPTTFPYSKRFSGDPAGTCTSHPNTATFTTNTTSTTGSASATVQDCQGANLSVNKTAAATFTSNINKTGPPSPVEHSGADTLNYTITVTESGWQVYGNIYVTNPNDWESIPVTLADLLSDAKGVCSISGGNVQTVPAGATITPGYVCTFTSAPGAANGTNSATATWDSITYHTTLGSASRSAGYTFGSLTVTDAFNNPTTPKTLGTISAPTAITTYTDSYSVTPNSGTCTTYPNIATITQTGQTANWSVTVCNTNTGGLTMGFWQNKNGQALITGFASNGGVCNLTGYLRSYAPFQDLSATASCSTVASYVYNIIKAANASGASMNAMLKAQDLATTLDVGITTPALGGVKINLTKVCNMLDGSSGSATCSGSYLNVSSAFGGAASLTVAQMLGFAASQSNAGGSSWYGQNKTIQGLAKDAFDAINSQAAFIAP